MLNDFLRYIEENKLAGKDDKILLAVSGGIDSMVMADLFFKTGFDAGIAHCNFCLRGKESDKDEELVRKFSVANKIPFFSKKFNTKAYSKKMGVSIQMAARDLRYEWFEEVRQSNGFDFIAVAHNLNDNIETLLLNLTRGTGIAGLTGMRPSGNHIIRPLLFATRDAIAEYCKMNSITYREDKSNAETKYTRNKIRHLVLPVLKEINPSIEVTLNETAERLRSIYEIVSDYTARTRNNLFIRKDSNIILNISLLQPYLKNRTFLFELFRPFGITEANLTDFQNIVNGKTGRQIFTGTHRIIKNRREIIISEKSEPDDDIIIINTIEEIKKVSFIKSGYVKSISESFKIPTGNDIACLDFKKVSFPLIIRKWQPGDFFYPLGMNQKKKLSDYFIDRKFSKPDKEKALIIESAGRILWIIGERIDNRFRVTGSTKKVLVIKA